MGGYSQFPRMNQDINLIFFLHFSLWFTKIVLTSNFLFLMHAFVPFAYLFLLWRNQDATNTKWKQRYFSVLFLKCRIQKHICFVFTVFLCCFIHPVLTQSRTSDKSNYNSGRRASVAKKMLPDNFGKSRNSMQKKLNF